MNTDQGLLPAVNAGISYDEEGKLPHLLLAPQLHLCAPKRTASPFPIIFNGS